MEGGCGRAVVRCFLPGQSGMASSVGFSRLRMCLQQEERDLLSPILMARFHRALPRGRMKEKKSVMHFREGGRPAVNCLQNLWRLPGISFPWLPSQKQILGFKMRDPRRRCRERLVRWGLSEIKGDEIAQTQLNSVRTRSLPCAASNRQGAA